MTAEASATIAPKCYTWPKTNRAFWDRKREENMARDRRALWIAP
jgi:G:T-mismatch repair DNA endonuclease (very short patch repair protein)